MVAQLRGKPGGADLPVSIGDFAEVSAPGGPYGLIYVVFNTFLMLPTQDDQVRCFARVAANLVPGGVFVMEAFVPDLTRFDEGQRVQVDQLDPPPGSPPRCTTRSASRSMPATSSSGLAASRRTRLRCVTPGPRSST